MTGRIIDISSPARLTIAHRQLVIARAQEEDQTIPAEDIGILLLNHPAISLNQSVLTCLAQTKAAVVFCDTAHMPAGLALPLVGHTLQGERLRQQMSASGPLRKRLWQAVVRCKIERQGDVLALFEGEAEGFRGLARRVRSGDPDNLEAQAAQRYWPRLLGKTFRRERFGTPPNGLLNYGYAVMRAGVARALCLSGLSPGIGIFHHNRANSFPLADDLMEVYRPYVDCRVKEMVERGDDLSDLTKDIKQSILSVLQESIRFDEASYPLSTTMQRLAASLARSFAENKSVLLLPQGFCASP